MNVHCAGNTTEYCCLLVVIGQAFSGSKDSAAIGKLNDHRRVGLPGGFEYGIDGIGADYVDRRQGKIIFTASLLTFQGGITVPGYAASKGAIGQLTKALANEWAAHNVQVNAIAPGYIQTDNTQALQDDPERSKSILSRIPAGRWGRPEDLAGATVFLASPASDYVNGHVLTVDGGWMAR